MAKFVLTAQLQLQAPTNTGRVLTQIKNQLSGVKIPIDVKGAAKAQKQIKKVADEAKRADSAAQSMGRSFGLAVKRFAAFTVASRAVSLVTNSLANAVEEAISFQREMIKIAQVTGKTVQELQGLQKTITDLAIGLGTSSKDLLTVTRILSQAGIKANDLNVALTALAKTTLAPTFTDIEQTAEGAVAILRQFGQGVGALERQLGAINAVAGQFAVESGDLIGAVRRFGGVFKAAGGSLEELIALFTSVRATTRESAESISTGLRTIFTRIQRPKTIQYLKNLGIELTDTEGKFVGPMEAVKRLSNSLADLEAGDVRFIRIAEELGGFRQIGKVIPLLQQFETAERARQAALAGGESLTRDAATAQQALAVQITKVKEEFAALVRGLAESTSFQLFTRTALSLASALLKIMEALKPLIPLLAAMAAFKMASGIGGFFKGAGASVRGMGKSQGGRIHAFARGGLVPGSGSRDTVSAALTPGEFVIRKSSVQSMGADKLQAMNDNKMAGGGKIGILAMRPSTSSPDPSGKKRQRGSSKPTEVTEELSWKSVQQALATSTMLRGGDTKGNKSPEKDPGDVGSNSIFILTGGKGGYRINKRLDETQRKKIESEITKQWPSGKVTAYGATFSQMEGADSPKIEETISNTVKTRIKDSATEAGASLAKLLGSGFGSAAATAQSVDDVGVADIAGKVFEAGVTTLDSPHFKKAKKGASGSDFDFAGGVGDKISKALPAAEKLKSIPTDGKATLYKGSGGLSEAIQKKYKNDQAAEVNQSSTWQTMRDQMVADLSSPDPKEIAGKPKSAKRTSRGAFGGPIRGYASGGTVDTVPALLTPGEFVVNKKSAQRVGYAGLNKMNKSGVEGFAAGGVVGVQKFAEGGGVAGGNMMAISMIMSGLAAANMALEKFGDKSLEASDKMAGTTIGMQHFLKALTMIIIAFMLYRKASKSIDGYVKKTDEAGKHLTVFNKAVDGSSKKVKAKGDTEEKAADPAGGGGGGGGGAAGGAAGGAGGGGAGAATPSKKKVVAQAAGDARVEADVKSRDNAKDGLKREQGLEKTDKEIVEKRKTNLGTAKDVAHGKGLAADNAKAEKGKVKEKIGRAKRVEAGRQQQADKAFMTPGQQIKGQQRAAEHRTKAATHKMEALGAGGELATVQAAKPGAARAVTAAEAAQKKAAPGLAARKKESQGIIARKREQGRGLGERRKSLQGAQAAVIKRSATGKMGNKEAIAASKTIQNELKKNANARKKVATSIKTQRGVLVGVKKDQDKLNATHKNAKDYVSRLGVAEKTLTGDVREHTRASQAHGDAAKSLDQDQRKFEKTQEKLEKSTKRRIKAEGKLPAAQLKLTTAAGKMYTAEKRAVTMKKRLTGSQKRLTLQEKKSEKAADKLARAEKKLQKTRAKGTGPSMGRKVAGGFAKGGAMAAGLLTMAGSIGSAVTGAMAEFANRKKEQAIKGEDVGGGIKAAGTASVMESMGKVFTIGGMIEAISDPEGFVDRQVQKKETAEAETGVQISAAANARAMKDMLNSSTGRFRDEEGAVNVSEAASFMGQGSAQARAEIGDVKSEAQRAKLTETLNASIRGSIQAFVDSGASTEDIMNSLGQLSGGNEKFRQELEKLAKMSLALRDAQAQLVKANFDSLKITSAFAGANSAVTLFTSGLITGSDSLGGYIAQIEAARSTIGVDATDAIEATRDQLLASATAAGGDPGLTSAIQGQANVALATNKFSRDIGTTVSAGEVNRASGEAAKKDLGEMLRAAIPEDADEQTKKQLNKVIDAQLAGITDKNVSTYDISDVLKKIATESAKLSQGFFEAAKLQSMHNKRMSKLYAEKEKLELKAAMASNKAIDAQLEAAKVFEQFGGVKATTGQKLQARVAQFNNIGGMGGLGAELGSGSASDIRKVSGQIGSTFNRQTREVQGDVTARGVFGAKAGPGIFAGPGGHDKDMRPEAKRANAALLKFTKDRVKLLQEELQIVQKKNAAEKSALDKLIGGDIAGFIEGQAAAGAAAALKTGDAGLAGLFGAGALGAGFKTLQGQGLGDDQMTRAAGLTLGAVGIEDQRAAQVMAGSTAEEESIKAAGREMAGLMGQVAQQGADFEQAEIAIKSAVIQVAELTFERGLREISERNMATGGLVYANRGMFVPRGTDTVPAMLTPGEFIINRSAVKRGNNLQILRAMNSRGGASAPGAMSGGGQVGYYQFGGLAEGIANVFSNALPGLSTAFAGFAETVQKLIGTKFQVALDPTNINVNFNGGAFLTTMKDEIRKELLAEVEKEIGKAKLDNTGKLGRRNTVLG
jgi:hypothetical protein